MKKIKQSMTTKRYKMVLTWITSRKRFLLYITLLSLSLTTCGGDGSDQDQVQDQDNDGVNDFTKGGIHLDLCPNGETGWTSGPNTDHDGDGCRDASDEDLDDDNDGTADVVDSFPLDECAATDTDKDGNPDTLVADCTTDLTEDPDDDNDGLNDIAANGLSLDRCPRGETGWTSGPSTDHDGDGCRDAGDEDPDDDNDNINDAMDVDDDNNRLIEIDTLDELELLRDDLNGDGMDDGNIPEITTLGSVGCPRFGCEGYELTRSLNFSDADSYADGSGNMRVWTNRGGRSWVPIGSCSSNTNCSASYTGTFDGNGHSIADLLVSLDDVHGVGLFGAVARPGIIQNLRLLNAKISGGGSNVGMLAGYGRAHFENVHAEGGSVNSPSADNVGGLVGDGERYDTIIHYSSVSDGSVSGRDDVGGLVGFGQQAAIRYSSVSGGSVSGRDDIGGLVGFGQQATIRYSSVSGGSVSGRDDVGGLVGFGQQATIRYSSVSGGSVSGRDDVGGLLGNGQPAYIRVSFVSGVSVFGNDRVGGLVGSGGGLTGLGLGVKVHSSFVSGGFVSGLVNVAGLVGDGRPYAEIRYSYSAAETVSGLVSVAGLVSGFNNPRIVLDSYWDRQTRGGSYSGNRGEPKTTNQLQNPTMFTGIYVSWGNLWCNPTTGEDMESPAQPDGFVRVWDLGTRSEYPTLNSDCLAGGLIP